MAIQPIAAGTEVTIPYDGSILLTWPLMQRKAFLKSQFGFDCACIKCTTEQRDNPFSGEDPTQDYYAIGCATCHHQSKLGSVMNKVKGKDNLFRCSLHGHEANTVEIRFAYTILKSLDTVAGLLDHAIFDALKNQKGNQAYELMIRLERLIENQYCPLLYSGSVRLVQLYATLVPYMYFYATQYNHDHSGIYILHAWKLALKRLAAVETSYGPQSHPTLHQLRIIQKWFAHVIAFPAFESINDVNQPRDKYREITERIAKLQSFSEVLSEI